MCVVKQEQTPKAMFEQSVISFRASQGALNLADVTILVDQNDFAGVHHAVRNLADDFVKVTARELRPHRVVTGDVSQDGAYPKTAIIVGSIEASRLIQKLEKSEFVEFAEIQGKWEPFMTVVVDKPLPGCERALVIAGSDKRGAIFGVYTISEQIGVSP